MSLNIKLNTIVSVLILDNNGSRLYAKYYNTQSNEQYSTLSQQKHFESSLFGKIYKVNQDIILYDNHLITYRQSNDVILVVVSNFNENESMIYSLCINLYESLNILLNNAVDKANILEKYDLVSLAIDEAVDDGIILEFEPAVIVSRVTNPPIASGFSIDINSRNESSERGLFSALSFASKKIGERLQQGL